MKRDLRRALMNLDDVGFRELEHSITIARKCGDLILKYNKTPEWFATEMGISMFAVREFLTGCHAFTIEEIAKIDVLAEQLEYQRIKQEMNAQ